MFSYTDSTPPLQNLMKMFIVDYLLPPVLMQQRRAERSDIISLNIVRTLKHGIMEAKIKPSYSMPATIVFSMTLLSYFHVY